MSRRSPVVFVVWFVLLPLALLFVPVPAHAQAPAQRAKVIVTVVDQSSGLIPGATVTIVESRTIINVPEQST